MPNVALKKSESKYS